MDINKAFTILLGFEGGLSSNSADKGGLTKYGISKAAYPDIDIESLTEEEAKAIYEKDYWNAAGCNKVKNELQYILFDTAVNCGVRTAIKLLQKAARVIEDGIMGPDTINASAQISIQDFAIERVTYYKAIVVNNPSQTLFLKGWLNRVNSIIDFQKSEGL